jgi:hypothetical protein
MRNAGEGDGMGRATYVLVPEEGVHAPGEGLAPPVQVVVGRGLGELAAVLVLQVFDVCSVLFLGIVDPGGADGNWTVVSLKQSQLKRERLTARDADEVAGFKD